MEEQILSIDTRDGNIYGILTRPSFSSGISETGEAGQYPASDVSGDDSGNIRESDFLVILCHGLMMSCQQNPVKGISDSLVNAGYSTLRFDFRGSGNSSGNIVDMTPETEISDLINVIRYAIVSGLADPRKIVLCGHSLGGLVSMITAARLQCSLDGTRHDDICNLSSYGFQGIAGLILMAPAVNIETDSREGRVALVRFDPDNIPEKLEVWDSWLGRNYFLAARSLDTFNTISEYQGPVSVIMGDRDRLVALDYSSRIAEALPQAEIHIIPHGDHLFSRGLRLKLVAISSDFLSRLRARQ